jgi:hypothetical protein
MELGHLLTSSDLTYPEVFSKMTPPARWGIQLDRLQNKYTNCKGIKNNTNFRKITGIQEKLDTTRK